MKPHIAVIGAGWAGLASAVELAHAAEVTVFEAGRAPGGRARCVRGDADRSLDNGQHILLGAYGECLRLMRQVGVDPRQALLRLPLAWQQPDGLRMRCPRLPAPLHLLLGLLCATGLSWGDKWHLARALGALSAAGWRVEGDPTVAGWMAEHGQGAGLLAAFWRPLVLSAMNTPIEQASMRILAAVLRDSLGAARAASDLLLPRVDLSSLFPDPACDWLRAQGATIRTGCRVNAVASADGGAVRVDGERFDAAIVACAPYHAAPLLADEHLSAAVKTMTFWPIYTVYLGFDRAPRLPEVMLGLRDGTAHWLFDREVLCGEAGMVAAVISAPAPDERRAGLDLVAAVLADVQRVAPHLPAPLWSRVVVDKRATFAARAGFTRPGMRLDIPSVYLAGDWIESAYPATLEGAVRSGVAAAHALMRDLRKKQ